MTLHVGAARAFGSSYTGRAGSARRPVHLALSEYVHMNVVDGLPTLFIAVHDDPETLFTAQFQCQTLRGKQDMPGQCLVVFGQVIGGMDVLDLIEAEGTEILVCLVQVNYLNLTMINLKLNLMIQVIENF